MLPRLTQLVRTACCSSAVAFDRGYRVVRFVYASEHGSTAADCTVAVTSLDMPAVDEFVQLTDLLTQGTDVPSSRGVQSVISDLAADAFWGSARSVEDQSERWVLPSSSWLLDAVFLPTSGGVAAGWFHHGHGAYLPSVYIHHFAMLAHSRRVHLLLLAADVQEAASKVFSEGNVHRHSVWRPASSISGSTLRSAHHTQLHSLLRAVQRRVGAAGAPASIEDAWIVLHVHRHVWWLGKTVGQRWEAARRLTETAVAADDRPLPLHLERALATDGRYLHLADGRLAAGWEYLFEKAAPREASQLFSQQTLSRVAHHVHMLQLDERHLFFTDVPLCRRTSGRDGDRDVDTPDHLITCHLERSLLPRRCGRGAEAPAVKRRSKSTQSRQSTPADPRCEFTAFSIGVDAGRYWSSLLSVADLLCAHYSACDGDELFTYQVWQHALRAVILRRYGAASSSTWLSADLTARAFPFLNALQRSLDAHPHGTDSGASRWRLVFLTHGTRDEASRYAALPPEWQMLVEVLQPHMAPCFAYSDLRWLASPRTGPPTPPARLRCDLFGVAGDTRLAVDVAAEQWQQMKYHWSCLSSPLWLCLAVKNGVCHLVLPVERASARLLMDVVQTH